MPKTFDPPVKALMFDVFGTCVDWRGSVAAQGEALGRRHGIASIDWFAFADAWRALYSPAMEEVRSGRREWTKLDVLHRESLGAVAEQFKLALDADVLDEFNLAWHRLEPWPDTVPGLTRLKRKFIIAPNSNAHIALSVNLAKHAGLPWDVILGSEVTRAFKPMPEAYLRSVASLGLRPSEVMMVAAHNYDLMAASKLGLRTGFVVRPREHGEGQTADLVPAQTYDVNAKSFEDLAAQLAC